MKTYNADFGDAVGIIEAVFTVTDADALTTHKVIAALSPYLASGDDDAVIQPFNIVGYVPVDGFVTLYATCLDGPTNGQFDIHYTLG
jgi:hypothetical protein